MGSTHDGFLAWCQQSNILIHPHVSLHKFETMGYGIKANKDIKSGEIVVQVPPVCQLSFLNSSFNKEVAHKISIEEYNLNSTQKLALALMCEMSKPDSFFRPYLSILPQAMDSILFWSASELLELENTCLEDMEHEEITKEFNDKITPLVDKWRTPISTASTISTTSTTSTISSTSTTSATPMTSSPSHSKNTTTSTITLELYKTALGIVLSRAFQVQDGVPYLCPVIDMINAKTQSSNIEVGTNAKVPESTTLDLIAKVSQDIPEGQQLFVTYGAFSNSELLRKYGYVEENNKFNEVHIDMEIVGDICLELFGELSEERQAFIETDTLILGAEITSATFLDDLRKVAELHMLDDEDFALLTELAVDEGREAAWSKFHEESGGMDDKQLRGVALLVLGRKLADYPTSLEEDKAWLLNNGAEYSRKKLAVELRVSEKTILVDWMNHIKGARQTTRASEPKRKTKKTNNTKKINKTKKDKKTKKQKLT